MKRTLWLLFGTVLCWGCATTTPQQRTYGLGFELATSDAHITTVTLADYLRSDHLIIQISEYELQRAQFHRWLEPLEQGVARVLSRSIKSNHGQTQIKIETLHGHTSGTVVLTATAELSGCGEMRWQSRRQQPVAGYPAMVAQQEVLLVEFAAAITERWQTCDAESGVVP